LNVKRGIFFSYKIFSTDDGQILGNYTKISPKELTEKDYKEVDEMLSKLRKDDY